MGGRERRSGWKIVILKIGYGASVKLQTVALYFKIRGLSLKDAVFILLFFGLASFPLFAQSSLPLLERIILSQEDEIIASAYDLAVTKEENFFLSDLYDQKLKLYDRKGQFIKSWKMRGQGPGEYQSMGKINFMDPYLGILDRPGFKLVLYEFKISQELEWVKNIQSESQSLSNFQFSDNMVIFDGLVMDENVHYYLNIHNLKEKMQTPLLPAHVRFSQSPKKGVLSPGGPYAEYSGQWGPIKGYLDVYDKHIYSTWSGKSEIIKIDMDTKKWVVFNQKTKKLQATG